VENLAELIRRLRSNSSRAREGDAAVPNVWRAREEAVG
jgi:hypothetical protein